MVRSARGGRLVRQTFLNAVRRGEHPFQVHYVGSVASETWRAVEVQAERVILPPQDEIDLSVEHAAAA